MIDNQKAWEEISAALIEMQAERDALAAKCLSLENFCAEVAAVFENMGDSSINSSRLKRIDSVINVDSKTVLAAHDAEVAAKATESLIDKCTHSSDHGVKIITESMLKYHAAQLRTKAQQ